VLADLRVRGLGVIEDLTLRLGPGMTALTGETGAGKTLVVEALQLVLGARADAGLVRHGADGALVEATFDVDPQNGADTGELILGRAVAAAGRSKAYVDGRTVPQAMLAETSADLVDICGQHDHQSLLRAAAPARALDAFAGIDTAPLTRAVHRRDELRRRLDALGGDEAQRARELDVLRFQVAEIDAAGIGDVD
jgi:DNA repair protein RecN (Recombination protein N)